MDTLTIALVIGTVITAYTVKAITGFGASLIIIPLLAPVFGIKEIIILAALGDVISSSIFAFRDRKFITLHKMKEVGAGLLIGTIIGVSILNAINPEILKNLLGIFILIYLFIQYAKPSIKITSRRAKSISGYIFGFIGGLCGGIFNTNGPALFVYVKSIFRAKERIRANLLLLFLVDSLWRTTLMASKGMVTPTIFITFITIVFPALLVGAFVGNSIDKKLHAKHYTLLSKLVLVWSGVKLLIR